MCIRKPFFSRSSNLKLNLGKRTIFFMILHVTLLVVFINRGGIWGISEVINEGVSNLLLRSQYLCLLTLLFGIELALTERPVLLQQTELLFIGSIIRS